MVVGSWEQELPPNVFQAGGHSFTAPLDSPEIR